MMCQEELPKLISTPLLREFPLGTCIPRNLSEGLGRLKVLMVPHVTRNTVIMWAPGLVGSVAQQHHQGHSFFQSLLCRHQCWHEAN